VPLVAPVLEGRKFFCPKCGALYCVTNKQFATDEANLVKCAVCLQVMDRSDSKNVPIYKLIHRPEDA